MWSINESLIVLVAVACSDPHTSLFWLSCGSSLNNIRSPYFGCLPESSLLLISGLYLTKPWRFTLQTLSLVRHCMLVQKLRQSYHILVLDILTVGIACIELSISAFWLILWKIWICRIDSNYYSKLESADFPIIWGFASFCFVLFVYAEFCENAYI
jgi:hypothetical protein